MFLFKMSTDPVMILRDSLDLPWIADMELMLSLFGPNRTIGPEHCEFAHLCCYQGFEPYF
jgi:hypothetical protein